MTQAHQEDVSQLLQPYVDGELSDDERMRVMESLESSESARMYVQTQTQVRDLLQSLPSPQAPEQLRVRIREALTEVEEAQQGKVVHLSRWRKRLASVSITLLPAAAAAAMLFMYVRGDPSTSAELGGSARGVIDAPKPSAQAQAQAPASIPLTRTAVRPANLHLPQGVQLVSSAPLPLGTDIPGESLEIVDSSDGQRFLLRIRPGTMPRSEGRDVVLQGRRFRRVKTAPRQEALEFTHGGRIVTITAVQRRPEAPLPADTEADAAFQRMLGIAQSLEIK